MAPILTHHGLREALDRPMVRYVNCWSLVSHPLPRFREPHLGVILPTMYLARVYVTLKPTVNDPPGLTIRGGLHSLGFANVQSVRSGKYMELRLDATSRADAEAQTAEMCRKLLANPVIEDFRYELEELPVTA